jgi:hypothetical protein
MGQRDFSEGRYLNNDADSQRNETGAETMFRALVYTGIQSPLNGVTQLLDAKVLPSVQFIDAPQDTRSGAALTGSALASLGHTYGMVLAGNRIGGKMTEAMAADFATMGRRVAATAAMGSLYGGVFTPVANNDPNSALDSRLWNATAGAAGLGMMSAGSSFYMDMIGGKRLALYHATAPFVAGGFGVIADKLSATGKDDWAGGSVFMPTQRLRPVENYYPKQGR